MAQAPEHPATDQLVAFGMGRLAPEQASTIEAHLDDCPTCCETLLDLKDDTFIALIRSAPQSDEVVADAAAVLPGSVDSRTDGPDVDDGSFDETVMLAAEQREARKGLPQELAEHPRYHIAGLIGRGGMGDVYRAEHRLMSRTVALKVINRELTRNAQAVQRFHREVQSAARLTHPNIVTAYDAEQAGEAHYLVMEYVDGTDLAKLVKEQGPLAVDRACDYVRQAATGLQHAHEQGMVHRDIKPHNLMVTPAGQIKILDFGLATLVRDAGAELRDAGCEARDAGEDSSASPTSRDAGPHSRASHPESRTADRDLTTAGTMMGTPDFISPEQAGDARSVDIRSDIYSLGCTLYYLLTGRPPFDDGSAADRVAAHLDREPVAIQNLRSDLPDELAEVIRRMMAKDPAERYQSPTEVADALAPFVDAHRSSDGGGSDRFRAMRPPVQRPSLVGLYVVGSLSTVIFALSFGVLNPLFAGTAEWIQWWWRIGSKVSLPVGALILILADRSERTNSHAAALKAGWLSLLPLNPVSVLLLPVTVWTIFVLRRPETRRAYERGDLPVVDDAEAQRRWPMVIAMVGSILIALAGTIIYVTTDRGTLVIESVDDSVEIVLSQVDGDAAGEASEDATQLKFVDVVSGSTVKVLRSGTYVAQIQGDDTGLELNEDRFVLRRGDKILVRVTRKPSSRTRPDKSTADSPERRGSVHEWTPPASPDPGAILNEAHADVNDGRFATALSKLDWYYKDALELRPSQSAVRLSFALSYWKKLADQYPPALDGLRELRDEAEQHVLSDGDPFQSFQEFAAICATLGEDERVVKLFQWLHPNNPMAAQRVYDVAEPALIRTQNFEICSSYIDPTRDVPRIIENLRRHRDLQQRMDKRESEFRANFAENKMTNQSATLVALLVVNGREAEARAAAEQLKSAWDSETLHEAIDSALAGQVPEPWPPRFQVVPDDTDSAANEATRDAFGSMTEQPALQPPAATGQTRQTIAEIVTATRDATSAAEWNAALKRHGALIEEEEFDGDGSDQFGRAELDKMQAADRRLIRLLVELPDAVRDQLLEDGYLKWKFSELDPERRTAMQQALVDVMSASGKMGFQKDLAEYVPGMLTSGDVGFAILNVPDADEQLVVWYLLMPEAPMPLMLPLIGSAGESEQAFAKSIYRQLGELEDRPFSKLPMVPAAKSE